MIDRTKPDTRERLTSEQLREISANFDARVERLEAELLQAHDAFDAVLEMNLDHMVQIEDLEKKLELQAVAHETQMAILRDENKQFFENWSSAEREIKELRAQLPKRQHSGKDE